VHLLKLKLTKKAALEEKKAIAASLAAKKEAIAEA